MIMISDSRFNAGPRASKPCWCCSPILVTFCFTILRSYVGSSHLLSAIPITSSPQALRLRRSHCCIVPICSYKIPICLSKVPACSTRIPITYLLTRALPWRLIVTSPSAVSYSQSCLACPRDCVDSDAVSILSRR